MRPFACKNVTKSEGLRVKSIQGLKEEGFIFDSSFPVQRLNGIYP